VSAEDSVLWGECGKRRFRRQPERPGPWRRQAFVGLGPGHANQRAESSAPASRGGGRVACEAGGTVTDTRSLRGVGDNGRPSVSPAERRFLADRCRPKREDQASEKRVQTQIDSGRIGISAAEIGSTDDEVNWRSSRYRLKAVLICGTGMAKGMGLTPSRGGYSTKLIKAAGGVVSCVSLWPTRSIRSTTSLFYLLR